MQLIGLMIFIGILILLLTLAIYLARSEKSKNEPYGSWSNVLGPQFRGSAFDVGENLKKEMEGEQQLKRGRRPRHSKKKKGGIQQQISIYNSYEICYDRVCLGM